MIAARSIAARGALALGLVASALFATQRPADAFAYGGWNARVSFNSWHDDNLSRGLVVSPSALPYGNQDLGLNMGLSLGNVFVLAPDLDTWLIGNLYGRTGFLYPTLSSAWGSIFSNTVRHLDGGRELYLLLGTTAFWGNGHYFAGETGFVQPLWAGANARVEAGAGTYMVETAGASFGMPSLGLGFDQAFSTGTQLGARYAYQTLFYDAGRVDPRHQLYLLASQRIGGGWELHARYLRTFATSPTAGYQEGYFDLGMDYDF